MVKLHVARAELGEIFLLVPFSKRLSLKTIGQTLNGTSSSPTDTTLSYACMSMNKNCLRPVINKFVLLHQEDSSWPLEKPCCLEKISKVEKEGSA